MHSVASKKHRNVHPPFFLRTPFFLRMDCGLSSFFFKDGGGPRGPQKRGMHPPFLFVLWIASSGLLAYFVSQRVAGTLGRPASGAFCLGRGVFHCPLTGPIFHTHFLSLPHFFFSLALGARYRSGELDANGVECQDMM